MLHLYFKNNMNIKYLYTILVSTSLAACSSETLTDAKLTDELLNIEKEVELTAIETEQQVAVSADCHWEVAVNKDTWADLTVQPLSGDGNGIITLKTNSNSTVNERTATLVISSQGGLRQKITIRQTLGGATLVVNKSELAFDAETTASQTFTVTSNTDWNILGLDADWASVEPMSGSEGTTEVKVTVSEIQDDRDRSTTLTVALANGTGQHDVHISQPGKTNISLTLTPEQLEPFKATGGTQTVSIRCNARWYVDVPEKPDWLMLSTDGGTGNGELTITCAENKTMEPRMLRIHFTSGSRTPKQTSIVASQRAATLPEFTTPLTLVTGSLTNHEAAFTFGYQSAFPLTAHGFCYSTTSQTPTIGDGHIPLGAGTTADASVSTILTGLSPLTTYYVRAYIQSDVTPLQTLYSNMVTITTLGNTPGKGENPYPQY